MTRLRPTRFELLEMCVLLVLTVGLWFGLQRGVIDRKLMPMIINGYLVYLAVRAVRDLHRWFTTRSTTGK
jgi:hypothetical protein